MKVIAQNAHNAIQPSIRFILDFLSNNGHKEFIEIFNKNIDDEPGKNRPRVTELDEIMDVFKSVSIFNESNTSNNGEKLTWIEKFIKSLKESNHLYYAFLKQYGNTNNQLIDSIIELRSHAQDLEFMLHTINTYPGMKSVYVNGIPIEQHLDFIRHYLLRLLRTQRLIREITNVSAYSSTYPRYSDQLISTETPGEQGLNIFQGS